MEGFFSTATQSLGVGGFGRQGREEATEIDWPHEIAGLDVNTLICRQWGATEDR